MALAKRGKKEKKKKGGKKRKLICLVPSRLLTRRKIWLQKAKTKRKIPKTRPKDKQSEYKPRKSPKPLTKSPKPNKKSQAQTTTKPHQPTKSFLLLNSRLDRGKKGERKRKGKTAESEAGCGVRSNAAKC